MSKWRYDRSRLFLGHSAESAEAVHYVLNEILVPSFTDEEIDAKFRKFFNDEKFNVEVRVEVALFTIDISEVSLEWGFAHCDTDTLECFIQVTTPTRLVYDAIAQNPNFSWNIISPMLVRGDNEVILLDFLERLTLEAFDFEMVNGLFTTSHYLPSNQHDWSRFRNRYSSICRDKARSFFEVDDSVPDSWVEKLAGRNT